MTSLLSRRLIEAAKIRCILLEVSNYKQASARSISSLYSSSSSLNSCCLSQEWKAPCFSGSNGVDCTLNSKRLLVPPKGPSLSRIQLLHAPPPKAPGRVTVTVKTDQETVTLEGKEGDSILDIVNDNNYEIPGYGACDGTIACSTCHVVLAQKDFDSLNKRVTEEEKDLLDMVRDLKDTSRLGCQVYVTEELDGLTVYVPDQQDLRDC